MPNSAPIPWKRLAAEATAIVLSILLAFWIDAWWQQKNALNEKDALIRGLQADFAASQLHVRQWLAGNQRLQAAGNLFLDALRESAIGDEVLVEHEWLVAAIVAPTYSPTDTTLRTAVASGKIELIEDSELRNALAVWRQQLEDTQEDEVLIREIVVNQLVPVLSRQVRLGGPFEFDAIISWYENAGNFDGQDQIILRVTPELEGVLAERIFYTTFVVNGLAAIHDTQAEILRLLEAQHGPG